jgi:uncharacterized protein YfaP (DUF2135 family)
MYYELLIYINYYEKSSSSTVKDSGHLLAHFTLSKINLIEGHGVVKRREEKNGDFFIRPLWKWQWMMVFL